MSQTLGQRGTVLLNLGKSNISRKDGAVKEKVVISRTNASEIGVPLKADSG